MNTRWSEAFAEFEALGELNEAARAERLSILKSRDEALWVVVQQLLSEPAISLQPIIWPVSETAGDAGVSSSVRLGHYSLIREIGRGGTGSVWLGERADGLYSGQVAIKVLSGDWRHNRQASQRFVREGELLAKLSHPGIARLLDAGLSSQGARYLVLEYVDGVSISQFVRTRNLSVQQTILLFLQVLEAVAHAHQSLILHRDIKPGNILVDDHGHVKLLDFGLGKLIEPIASRDVATGAESSSRPTDMTREVGIGFTPRYAPPEQRSGESLDAERMTTASDVYALGVTLYELLTHQSLDLSKGYTRPSARVIEAAALQALDPTWRDRTRSRQLKGDLDSIVAKAVEENPKRRYPNALAMAEDLQRYLRSEPVTAQADSTLYRASKFVRKHRGAVATGALATLAVLTSLGVSLWQTREAKHQRSLALNEVDKREKATQFVFSLLGSYAPKDRPFSSQELFEIGLQKIDTAFSGDPIGAALMAQSLGYRLSDLSLTAKAHEAFDLANRYTHQTSDRLSQADTLSLLAESHAKLGQRTQALDATGKALASLAEVPQSTHRRSYVEANVLYDQIVVARHLGDAPLALRAASALVEKHQATLLRGDSVAASGHARLAAAYALSMRYSTAIAARETSIKILEKSVALDHASLLVAYADLLDLHLAVGDANGALEIVKARLQTALNQSPRAIHPRLFGSLVRLYASVGDHDKFLAWITEREGVTQDPPFVKSAIALARFDACLSQKPKSCPKVVVDAAAMAYETQFPHNAAWRVGGHWVRARHFREVDATAALSAADLGLGTLQSAKAEPSVFAARLQIERAYALNAQGHPALAREAQNAARQYLTQHLDYPKDRSGDWTAMAQLDSALWAR